jgi:hypothetical protein
MTMGTTEREMHGGKRKEKSGRDVFVIMCEKSFRSSLVSLTMELRETMRGSAQCLAAQSLWPLTGGARCVISDLFIWKCNFLFL